MLPANFLEGQVQSNGEDVEGVEVRIMGTALTTFTNSKGMFKLDLTRENLHETYLISLQKKGYEVSPQINN